MDRRGDSVVVKIVDDGTGIDPKIQPFIFDLCGQVQENLARSQGGLGIGLTLVRRLVAMHKGEVSVKSDGVGKGSTFTVTLPLSANVV
ncbi:ATP-binding protein, partial [Acinetobacter baumannii]